jgi:hypothetical protein
VSRSPTARLAVLGLLAIGAAGCHGFEPTVRRSMSTDAKCSEDKIAVKSLSAGGYQAEGCGKSAVYDCSWPEGKSRSCTPRGAPPPPSLPGTGF